MTTKTAQQARTAAHKAAREKDSQDKRRRALEAIEALDATGAPVTVAAVAKAAGVSTWLIYSQGVREHLEAARRRQPNHGVATGNPSLPDNHRTTSASLNTDLAIAREEIRRLRGEHDKLRKRLRLHLGAEIEGPERAQLISRLADLEAVNRQLVTERDARTAEADTTGRRVRELEDELCAVRESLRRIIRTENRHER